MVYESQCRQGLDMNGYHRDGRRMRITVRQTIFGNVKYVVQGLGRNLMGWEGWATVGKFNTLADALEYAKFRYGFREQ